jgi:hypothetical protein
LSLCIFQGRQVRHQKGLRILARALFKVFGYFFVVGLPGGRSRRKASSPPPYRIFRFRPRVAGKIVAAYSAGWIPHACQQLRDTRIQDQHPLYRLQPLDSLRKPLFSSATESAVRETLSDLFDLSDSKSGKQHVCRVHLFCVWTHNACFEGGASLYEEYPRTCDAKSVGVDNPNLIQHAKPE